MFKWVVDGATAIALFTAFFYVSYTAYNQGYLKTFGIDTTIMEKSFHKTLYGGMLLCLDLAVKPIFYWFIIAMYFFLAVALYVLFAKKSIKNRRVIVRVKKQILIE